MKSINNELLTPFASRGLTIKGGIAIDARLVQPASHPLNFSRDLESDWTVRKNIPHYDALRLAPPEPGK
jgi:hypothetical protein